MHTDVSDFASVQALADAAYAEFGAVHVLCNNAGVLIFGDMQDLKIEDWNWLLGVNVFGVLQRRSTRSCPGCSRRASRVTS